MAGLNFFRWLRLTLVVGFSCLILLAGCSSTPNSTAAGKTLTVATEGTYPPFEFQSAEGELQGFDIDLMNVIAKEAGFTVQYQGLPFAGMIPALQAQTIDAAVAAMTITEERAKTISFSRPYFKSGLAIATRTNNQTITNFDSLKDKRIAVQIGTTGAQKAASIPGAEIRSFDDAPTTLRELLNGNVDAVVHDQPVILYAIASGNVQGVKVVSELLTEEYFGIPTPKGSPNLALINQGLAAVLKNGTYAQIYQKWFGVQPPPLPEESPFENQTANGVSALFSALSVFLNALPFLLRGALVTLQLTAFSVVLGLIGGSLIGIARLSQILPLRWAARAYIDFFRGTPLLVQIFMIYFGLPAISQELGITFTFDRLTAAVIALSLNSAAYIAEIVRGGIQSIEPGQAEAAQSLGMSSVQTMRYVIFPQAFRRMLPALGNEFISLLKDTSLVAVIGFEELFREGQLIVAENYRAFEIYAAVAAIYLCLTLLSSQAFSRLEKWLNPVNRRRYQQVKVSPN
ncbi:ABC transporter permease subunit [Chroococcidiopsis sp. CCMEE 29]|uniref:ABC transporter permease subunit n=1 Tax=Chroococcidiopsis sp. CCMEE 29 TaxID=155894 RepID=UPI0020215CE9|nr:ABC transporter permease subunit [Chroococcidiopsis sp. CCMEE 29]